MSRIYSVTNRIKFADIPEKYAIPRGYRAKQSEVHSAVVTYVFEHFKNTKKYRQQIVDALNCLTYCIMQNEPPPFQWSTTDPLETMPDMDMDVVEDALGDFFLTDESIQWDVPITDELVDVSGTGSKVEKQSETVEPVKSLESYKVSASVKDENKVVNRPLQKVKEKQKLDTRTHILPTPKEDLYIQPPKYPRFDVNKVWMSATVGSDNLVIYTSLPEVPTKQNEISITTNVESMTESELLALYPNQVIHTRSQRMYERYDGDDYDEDLGCIIPIDGFTRDQVVDNIIRYPHLYRLRKVLDDGKLAKFFSTIEINGELVPIGSVWDTLPDSKKMPRDPEFIKEYVIRKYLLEEEAGLHHKYRLFGTLDPFLTLFMPSTKYVEKGYKDTLSIVKQCVVSRVHYKQSRSPILRRLEIINE